MKQSPDIVMALAKIGELVTMTPDTSEILKQVVAITADIMKADVCSIYLYDDTGKALVLAATFGLNGDAVGNVRIYPGEGITGRAAKQGRLVAVGDVTLDRRNKYIPITGEDNLRSLLSIPLELHDEQIGVMNVQTCEVRAFSKEERHLLKTVAHQVSGIVRNARLYESVLSSKKELEKVNDRLIESEKMAALGRLSATLAHELRNPLSGLKGASQLLLRKTGIHDERRQYVNLIMEEVDRLGGIVEDLLHFAKPRALRYEYMNANDVIEDMLLLYSEEFSKCGISVRKRLSKLPNILADKDKFKQVIVNVIINAIEAMQEGGELFVSSSFTVSQNGRHEIAIFQFRDTGSGIPKDIIAHVIEPFYTTKPNGVGLGLAVCKTITEQHGGSISVISENESTDFAPSGTTITLKFPIMPAENPNSG
jgi:signal transduction histidine kinase